MDNASKALIMAGAILISVAIVGIGIYIFSAANNMTNDAVGEMESTQVSMFNNTFFRYAQQDDDILGTRLRELCAHADSEGVTYSGVDTESIEDRKSYKVHFNYDEETNSGYIVSITISESSAGAGA